MPWTGFRYADGGSGLDLKESALAQRKNGVAVMPGKPSESMLYQRISSADTAKRISPEYSHKSLTSAQVAKLKLWIEQGAPGKEHGPIVPPFKRRCPE